MLLTPVTVETSGKQAEAALAYAQMAGTDALYQIAPEQMSGLTLEALLKAAGLEGNDTEVVIALTNSGDRLQLWQEADPFMDDERIGYLTQAYNVKSPVSGFGKEPTFFVLFGEEAAMAQGLLKIMLEARNTSLALDDHVNWWGYNEEEAREELMKGSEFKGWRDLRPLVQKAA
jgi:hypothetical protein